MDYMEIPPELKELKSNTILSIDVMFVGGLGFFSTGSWGVHFLTQQHMSVWTINSLVNAENNVINFYNMYGFKMIACIADHKLEYLHITYALQTASTSTLLPTTSIWMTHPTNQRKIFVHLQHPTILMYACLDGDRTYIILHPLVKCIFIKELHLPALFNWHHPHRHHHGHGKSLQTPLWC